MIHTTSLYALIIYDSISSFNTDSILSGNVWPLVPKTFPKWTLIDSPWNHVTRIHLHPLLPLLLFLFHFLCLFSIPSCSGIGGGGWGEDGRTQKVLQFFISVKVSRESFLETSCITFSHIKLGGAFACQFIELKRKNYNQPNGVYFFSTLTYEC